MYVAVKGGEKAIDNAHALMAKRRRGDTDIAALTTGSRQPAQVVPFSQPVPVTRAESSSSGVSSIQGRTLASKAALWQWMALLEGHGGPQLEGPMEGPLEGPLGGPYGWPYGGYNCTLRPQARVYDQKRGFTTRAPEAWFY